MRKRKASRYGLTHSNYGHDFRGICLACCACNLYISWMLVCWYTMTVADKLHVKYYNHAFQSTIALGLKNHQLVAIYHRMHAGCMI